MRRLAVAALIAVVVGLIFAGATFAGGDHGRGHRGLTFFSTENALSLLPVTAGKFSQGDRVVFADDLFTAKGGTQVGTDGGACTVVRVTDAATGSGVLQCLVTFSLPGGQITTQALNTLTNGGFAGAQTGAITGGTGKYRDAAGQFTVEFLSGGETNITFFLDDRGDQQGARVRRRARARCWSLCCAPRAPLPASTRRTPATTTSRPATRTSARCPSRRGRKRRRRVATRRRISGSAGLPSITATPRR